MKRGRLLLGVIIATLVVGGSSASAATITVTATSDGPTAGGCSLREAVEAVDTPGSIVDGCAVADNASNVIVLGAHEYDLTIKPSGPDDQTTGDLDIDPTAPPLTITGAGIGATTINATALSDRAIRVLAGASVKIEGLTISGGHAPEGAPGQNGEPVKAISPTPGGNGADGGGILNEGTLALERVAVSGNVAGGGGVGGVGLSNLPGAPGGNGGTGGGIQNSGASAALHLMSVDVSGNFAGDGGRGGEGGGGGGGGDGAGGGCCGDGGGLENAGGTVLISGSTFSSNHAGAGGAGGAGGGSCACSHTGGAGGSGAGGSSGGAIAASAGTVTVVNSTFIENFGGPGGNGGDGGEDSFDSEKPNGGNSGNGSAGGGIFARGGATVTLTNVTIDANQVGGPGKPGTPGDPAATAGKTGNAAFGGGIYAKELPAITLVNGLLASNELGNCAGQVTDGGHNLSFGDSECPAGFLRTDPVLGPLQDNGGPTPTQALGPTSTAIDQVPASGASCPATDQRGVPRPSGPACDIGAYELTPPGVTEGAATSLTTSGATLNGSVTTNQATATARFEFGETTSYGSTVGAATFGGFLTPEAVSAPLAGLKSDTTYHFRLVATSPDGTTAGPDETFTTAVPVLTLLLPAVAPRITNLKFVAASVSRRHRRHASITYSDTQPALTTFVVERITAGVKQGRRCVRGRSRGHGHRCTLRRKLGAFTHHDKAGRNSFSFSGRIGGHVLARGSYVLIATPNTTVAGAAVSVTFTVR